MELDQREKEIVTSSSIFLSTSFLDSLFRDISVVSYVRKPLFPIPLVSSNKQATIRYKLCRVGFVAVPRSEWNSVGLSINHFVVVILCPDIPTLLLAFSRIEECNRRIEKYAYIVTTRKRNKTICWFDLWLIRWISSNLLTPTLFIQIVRIILFERKKFVDYQSDDNFERLNFRDLIFDWRLSYEIPS